MSNQGEVTLDTLAQMVANGFTRMDVEINKRFDEVDGEFKNVYKKLDDMSKDIRSLRQEVSLIHKDLDRLQDKVDSHSGFAKELDDLRERVIKIERQYGLSTVK